MTDTDPRRSRGALTPRPPQDAVGSDRTSILLVDDQPERLLSYEVMLADLPVRCVRALSGSDALEQMLKGDFALILLDVSMPVMDGFEVAQLVRAHPRFERTPIVFVTGLHLTEADHLRGYAAGAIDYIQVPVVPEVLRAKVAVLVELHQRRRELQATNLALADARAQLESLHEQTLAENEAQLQALLDHPTDPTIVLEAQRDAMGVIVDWVYRMANTNVLNLLGLARAQIVGKRLGDVLPERAAHNAALCKEVLSTREMKRYESRFKERDFLVTLFPMGTDRVVSSALDITERKRTMATLRASERRYRALIENAPVAVAHNTLDGRFEFANKAFCKLVGYTAEELQDLRWQDITHPDDVGSDQSRSEQAAAGRISHYTLEKRYVRKDGTVVWVNLFGNYLVDDDGRPVQGLAVVVDVTAERVATQRLQQSEERFRELANNIDQLAWTCDELCVANWYNQRWYDYTGTGFEAMQGEGWKKVHDPAHLDRVVAGLAAARQRGEPWEDTFPLRGADGNFRWFLSRAVPIRDASGRVVRWFGTNTDVTELRNLQEALRESDRRKDEFLAMLAHELRNPVAPIRNATEALLRLMPQPDQARGLIDIIDRQGAQLARLLDDLLDVARFTHGRIELRREAVAVAACIALAVETATPVIRAKRHRLAVTGTATPLAVHADKTRLAQCIANLLNNAAKFTPPDGEIRVHAFEHDGHAVVEISDTGMGIDAALLPNIFDRFAPRKHSPEHAQGGLGIGLSICRQLAELHGGTLSAKSDGAGRGATFAIRLPLASGASDARTAAAPPLRAGRRVLIVDDNRDAADSVAQLLKFMGHETTTAYSSMQALECAAASAPQVVLLDIGLPDIDGYELARRLRSLVPAARVVALSGYDREDDKRRSAAAGFDRHLVKPADLETLRQVLAEG